MLLRQVPQQWRRRRGTNMRDFVYHRAGSLEEARRLAKQNGALLLAGGQSLLRDVKLGRHSPTSLVDIIGLLPDQIAIRDGAISIGAGATHADVSASPVLRQHLPVLASLVGYIGDPAVRNRGTLGGAIAANETAGDYPAACLALSVTVHTTEREVHSREFFTGGCRTVLQAGEIIETVTFPIPSKAAYIKFLNPAARYAMVGVFVSLASDGTPHVAVTGACDKGAFRWIEAEMALTSAFSEQSIRNLYLPLDGLIEDVFADAEYRAHLAEVLTKRAVGLAVRDIPQAVVLSHGSRLGRELFQPQAA
jgi:carbon-monoxide dehydrogenase medium subunit